MTDHTCVIDGEGIILYANSALATICGRESIIPYSGTQDTIEWRD